jgi:hypothetical protein
MISTTWEVEVRGSLFQGSEGKKLIRIYLKEKARCGG